jgi:hypothetical protein
MALTTTKLTRLRPYADESSLERAGGHQINWAAVTAVNGVKSLKAGTVVGKKAGKAQPCATSVTLTSVAVATNVATATLNGHGFTAGDIVTIAGANLAYANGVKTIATVPDADTFTYAATGSDATATGTITARVAAQAILETDANESAGVESLSGYSLLVGGVVLENLLPDATGGPPKALPAAYKSELTSAGCTFKYVTYADSRS